MSSVIFHFSAWRENKFCAVEENTKLLTTCFPSGVYLANMTLKGSGPGRAHDKSWGRVRSCSYSARKDEAEDRVGTPVSTHGWGCSGTERLSHSPQVAQLMDDEPEIQRKVHRTSPEAVYQRSHFSHWSENRLTTPVTLPLQWPLAAS